MWRVEPQFLTYRKRFLDDQECTAQLLESTNRIFDELCPLLPITLVYHGCYFTKNLPCALLKDPWSVVSPHELLSVGVEELFCLLKFSRFQTRVDDWMKFFLKLFHRPENKLVLVVSFAAQSFVFSFSWPLALSLEQCLEEISRKKVTLCRGRSFTNLL